jgi:NAD(P) transhydrogenase
MVHTGTLPSKTLRETALYLTGFRRRELYGGLAGELPAALRSARSLMCRLPAVSALQARQIREELEAHAVELVAGTARLAGPHAVEVGARRLEAEFVLIATGSSPRRPAGFDFDDPALHDSDELLAMERLPSSLAVIGGGVVGSEYACVMATFGVRVEIIERAPRILGFLDAELSERLMRELRAAGITLHLGDTVERVAREGDAMVVDLARAGRRRFDDVLVSAGRTGNTAGLGLEALGVEVDDRGLVVVGPDLRSSVPSVFAAGDVVGKPGLASSAMEQGRLAVAAMFGLGGARPDWSTLASGIYTIPEAAAAGPTEAELVAAGVPIVVGRAELCHNAKAQMTGETAGLVKLIFHRETRRLLATHLVAEHATELVHLGQAVMRLGGGLDHLLESVMTYPSLSEAYKAAASDALAQLEPARRPAGS